VSTPAATPSGAQGTTAAVSVAVPVSDPVAAVSSSVAAVADPVAAVSSSVAAVVSDPLLQVVKGNPSAEELAALTAVVLALQPGEALAPSRPAPRQWVRRAQLNLAPKPGPGAWRRSRG
jgi:hypothetical protein